MPRSLLGGIIFSNFNFLFILIQLHLRSAKTDDCHIVTMNLALKKRNETEPEDQQGRVETKQQIY